MPHYSTAVSPDSLLQRSKELSIRASLQPLCGRLDAVEMQTHAMTIRRVQAGCSYLRLFPCQSLLKRMHRRDAIQVLLQPRHGFLVAAWANRCRAAVRSEDASMPSAAANFWLCAAANSGAELQTD